MQHPAELQDRPGLSVAEREQRQQARLRREMKEQERLKYVDPDRSDDLRNIWVIYFWGENKWGTESWNLAGFRRRRQRRKKSQTYNRFFAKLRRQFKIRTGTDDDGAPIRESVILNKGTELMTMDLQTAALLAHRNDPTWMFMPPKRQHALKPNIIITSRPPKAVKASKTKFRKRDAPDAFHKKVTRFIALGRCSWDREPGYTYLAPLKARTERLAQQEAKRTYNIYDDIKVVAVDSLSKKLRNAMHSARRVRPGVTRLQWPEPREPIALKRLLELPANVAEMVERSDLEHHIKQMDRMARRAAKSRKRKSQQKRDDKVAFALAVLCFLHELLENDTPSFQESAA